MGYDWSIYLERPYLCFNEIHKTPRRNVKYTGAGNFVGSLVTGLLDRYGEMSFISVIEIYTERLICFY